jgi:hypothetical protein
MAFRVPVEKGILTFFLWFFTVTLFPLVLYSDPFSFGSLQLERGQCGRDRGKGGPWDTSGNLGKSPVAVSQSPHLAVGVKTHTLLTAGCVDLIPGP